MTIEVRFEDFAKTYFLDALVEGGAAFEFKTVESLADRHRSQLPHYLFMVDLPHGKLVVVPNNSRVRDSIPLFSSPTFSCLIVKEVI